MNEAERLDLEHRRRIRKLYSLGDFALALSAAAFLGECDESGKCTKVELRRFRCYETTVIISYTRPFSQSSHRFPKLSLKMTGATLTEEQIALHHRLRKLRDKVIAHSDADMMRMTSQTDLMEFEKDFSFVLLQTVFDEGLTFIGSKFWKLNELLHVVHGSLYGALLREAQIESKEFNVRKDHLRG